MKLLLENWRKYINEGMPSTESPKDVEDSVRKAAKHLLYVKYFRRYKGKKWGGLPPAENSWASIYQALDIIEDLDDYLLSPRAIKEEGKLGTYFPIPEDADYLDEIDDIVKNIETKLHDDLKDMIIGRRVKIDTFKIHRHPEAKKHENEEGTIDKTSSNFWVFS